MQFTILEYFLLQWKFNEGPPSLSSQKLTVGLLLDHEFAFSTIDRGPPADSLEVNTEKFLFSVVHVGFYFKYEITVKFHYRLLAIL